MKLKQIIAAVLAAAMMTAMTACSSNGGEQSRSGSESSQSQTEGESESSDGKKFKVGVIQLVQHDALDAATQGFVDTLTEKFGDNVEIIVQNASGDSPTCGVIANQFVSEGVDLIMANATPALQAAAAATGTIPIVGTSVTDYATALQISDWTGKTGTNITGTADLAPLSEQAAMIKELFPEAKKVGILFCSAEPNSAYQANVIKEQLSSLGIESEEFTFADTNDVAAVTTTACGACDVLYIPTDNTAATCTETINNIAQPAGVPIITGEAAPCAVCGVATLSISYYDIGHIAGEMAAEILTEGKNPADMEIRFAPEVTKMYNPDICSALGVTVPEGYSPLEG